MDLSGDVLGIVNKVLGVDLWPKQLEIIKEFYRGEYQELILNCGMRSSKSFIAALIGLVETVRWILFPDPWSHYHIHPNSEVAGIITATSEKQAQKRSAFTYYRKMVMNSWWFQEHGAVVQELTVKFPGYGLEVHAMPSTSASQAGGTLLFAIMDELARFVETEGARGGDLVYDTLKAGCKTLRGKLLSISSPIYTRDKIMRLSEQAKAMREASKARGRRPSMLAYHLATWDLNPNLTRDDFADDFLNNPETAQRDWAAEPSYAMEPYFAEPDRLDRMYRFARKRNPTIDQNGTITGLEKKPETRYHFHGDPANKNDSFGLAVAHYEPRGDVIMVDLVHRFLPKTIGKTAEKEIDAEVVKATLLNIHRALTLKAGTFDMWNFPETVQALRRKKVGIEQLTIKKEQYDAFKERAYMDPPRVRIPTHTLEVPHRNTRMPDTVIDEMKELSLIKGQKIDHPMLGTKDVADAVVGACWGVTQKIGRRRRTELIVE